MYASTRSIGSMGLGQCNQFIGWHLIFFLRSAQVINQARNKEILESLRGFFCKTTQHVIERGINKISCGIWVRLVSPRRKIISSYLNQKAQVMCAQSPPRRIPT